MTRVWRAMAWGWLLAAGWMAPASAQTGYDRPGGTFLSFVLRSGDPAACAARCERDSHCRAWSFTYPSGSTPAACALKNAVTPPVESACCVSGVRGAGVVEPRDGKLEFSIDRRGGDLRAFEVAPDPRGATCAAACSAEAKCRAWTDARPGYVGPAARCYLKDRLKPPHRAPCCISGVVR